MLKLATANLENLSRQLAHELAGEAHFDAYQRALYASDASLYQIQPLGVVLPRSAEDVRITTRRAAEAGVPLIPRGSGTSLSGQAIGAGIVLDFSKYMNQILELDPQTCTARVQPG